MTLNSKSSLSLTVVVVLKYNATHTVYMTFGCFLAFLSHSPEVHTILGEKVAHATISLRLNVLSYSIQVQNIVTYYSDGSSPTLGPCSGEL